MRHPSREVQRKSSNQLVELRANRAVSDRDIGTTSYLGVELARGFHCTCERLWVKLPGRLDPILGVSGGVRFAPAGANTPPYRDETAKGWGTRLVWL